MATKVNDFMPRRLRLEIYGSYWREIINYKLMSAQEEKDNLMTLPLPERSVAVALKHIFDQVKAMQDEMIQQTQKVHNSFFQQYEKVEQQTSAIVNGAPLTIPDNTPYLNEEEKAEAAELAKNNKGIEAYWFSAICNFYGDDLSLVDKEIAAAVQDVSTKVEANNFQVTIKLAKNPWLPEGTLTKQCTLNEEGMVASCQGDKPEWLKEKHQGVFDLLLQECANQVELGRTFEVMGDFINEIVPYSLQNYLGAVDEDEEEQEEEDDEQDEEEEEDEPTTKKVKK